MKAKVDSPKANARLNRIQAVGRVLRAILLPALIIQAAGISALIIVVPPAIIANFDVVLAQRKMRLNDLAEAVGITPPNLSILKTGKARAVRFSTLEAIGETPDCRPGEILEYREEATKKKSAARG